MYFALIMFLGNYVKVGSSSTALMIYSFYTLVYGLLFSFFAYLFWKGKKLGLIGTAVSLFVIIVDALALFDLLNFLGIPTTSSLGEFTYSFIILFYLFEDHIRLRYKI